MNKSNLLHGLKNWQPFLASVMIIGLTQCLSRSFWLIGDFKGHFDHFGYFKGIFLVISKISSVLVFIFIFYDYYGNFGGFRGISIIWKF